MALAALSYERNRSVYQNSKTVAPVSSAHFGQSFKRDTFERGRSQAKPPESLMLGKHGASFGEPVLHKAILEGRFEDAQSMIEKGVGIHTQDAQGRTPLHVAAYMGNMRIVEALCAQGALLWANDHKGLTPMHTALIKGFSGVALFLSEKAANKTPEPRWKTESQVLQALALGKRAKNSFEQADIATAALCGQDVAEFLNEPEQVTKYIAHLRSWTDQTFSTTSEGWYLEVVLPMRIRSLVAMLLKDTSAPGKTPAQTRKTLTEELMVQLETLREARRMSLMASVDVLDHQKALFTTEATQVLSRVMGMPSGQEYCLAMGFPGHAMYSGMRTGSVAGTEVVSFRVDNLGAGFPKGHSRNAEGHVLSYFFNVPKAFLETEEGKKQYTHLLAKIFEYKYSDEANSDVLYSEIFRFVDKIKETYGADVVCAKGVAGPLIGHRFQTAGNCSLKNHSVSMAERLGKEVFGWVKQQEIDLTQKRIFEYVYTPSAFERKEDEKNKAVLEMIIEMGDADKPNTEELSRFFSKLKRKDMASGLDEIHVLYVLESKDTAAMALLLENGLSPDFTTASGDPLVVYAAKKNLLGMLKLLLEKGAQRDAEGSDGKTAMQILEEQTKQAQQALLAFK